MDIKSFRLVSLEVQREHDALKCTYMEGEEYIG